ncbi:5'-methylthioadenosine/adenosylhomocysteine nucleosidase [Listeria fleischmannii]|uniref:5'-methylthioadenosine/S-adenosylhomocysteine nucleosidase n=2 Tax=Listeria fleischmannii TaxID=1069827 RepID=A0A841YG34_9LIST|nr:5'-methylthioadenosine/adenosylhomocysteine nucleosidase [Listeria fleischmannii]MBC1427597.1 5'-methylthioadenosine/adenosylhomocysteine nucleosidase [Listeria fleischmannii]STY34906.1 5'-methylthioadenosine/S-adenosylhomocysteine nucleosidase [Listeria fleischmannii subsp. coloradonensis]
MIGIIGAMEEEVKILKEQMTLLLEEEIAGAKFYRGTLENQEVVLLQSGIGKVNAAISTTILCDHYKPEWIINTGSAGGIGPDLNVSDVIISSQLTYGDVDATAFGYTFGQVPQMPAMYQSDKKLLDMAEKVYINQLKESPNKVVFGLIVTTDSFIATDEKREAIKTYFPEVKAVEMEATAIAQVAHQFDTPVLIVRALSDVADKEAAISFDAFLETAAKASSTCILALLKEWDA